MREKSENIDFPGVWGEMKKLVENFFFFLRSASILLCVGKAIFFSCVARFPPPEKNMFEVSENPFACVERRNLCLMRRMKSDSKLMTSDESDEPHGTVRI